MGKQIAGSIRGIDIILQERARQMEKYSDEHDDDLIYRDLAVHAASLAVVDADAIVFDNSRSGRNAGTRISVDDSQFVGDSWKLQQKYCGNAHRIKRLAVAGALIAAEIDRLLRAGIKL